MLWSVTDVPTPPTTVTEERQLRIDYLLYQSTSLRLTGVGSLPKLSSPIPDDVHPSDHLPVSARLVLRPHWAQVWSPTPNPNSDSDTDTNTRPNSKPDTKAYPIPIPDLILFLVGPG